jgi:chromosome segregation ATPase
VVEQTPAKLSLDIWDERAPELLRQLLAVPELDARARAALQPVVDARAAIGRIDDELSGLQTQQDQLDERAEEERQNLLAIQKDPRAAALRKRLSQRLEELTRQAAELGRKIVELNSQRMEKKIELEDRLRELDFSASS